LRGMRGEPAKRPHHALYQQNDIGGIFRLSKSKSKSGNNHPENRHNVEYKETDGDRYWRESYFLKMMVASLSGLKVHETYEEDIKDVGGVDGETNWRL